MKNLVGHFDFRVGFEASTSRSMDEDSEMSALAPSFGRRGTFATTFLVDTDRIEMSSQPQFQRGCRYCL